MYDYNSSSSRQRKRIEDVGLVSHVRAQTQKFVEWLRSSSIGHAVVLVITDDTNIWAPILVGLISFEVESFFEHLVYAFRVRCLEIPFVND
jgi:hypothetical protein